VGILS